MTLHKDSGLTAGWDALKDGMSDLPWISTGSGVKPSEALEVIRAQFVEDDSVRPLWNGKGHEGGNDQAAFLDTAIDRVVAIIASNPRYLESLCGDPRALFDLVSQPQDSPSKTPSLTAFVQFAILMRVARKVLAMTSGSVAEPETASLDDLRLVVNWSMFITLSAPLRACEREEWKVKDGFALAFGGGEEASYRWLASVRDLRRSVLGSLAIFRDEPLLRDFAASKPGARELTVEAIAELLVLSETGRVRLLPDAVEAKDRPPHTVKSPDKFKMETHASKGLAVDLMETFFLPRFAFGAAWRITRAARQQRWVVLLGSMGIALAAFATWQFIWQCIAWPFANLVLAVVATATLVGPSLFLPDPVRMLWLPRVPAAVALGAAVLIPLSTHWWGELLNSDTDLSIYWWSSAAGLVIAVAYLVSEVRGHHVKGRLAIAGRVSISFAILFVYATVMTITVLLMAFPLFGDTVDGHTIVDALAQLGIRRRVLLLLSATTFSLVVGIFTQIVWEEKTITAPFAHASWRR